jgi:D-alanyl-D-alanine dipeptidase
MVLLQQWIPDLQFDLRYASNNNFLHQTVYPKNAKAYLRKQAVDALKKVQFDLAAMGLGLLIFDAYRPYHVTEKMWELVKDARYAADPRKGSGHNRGIAVDCSIINLSTKVAINMGTDFDNFTDTAHHGFTALPDSILQNRKRLKSLMEKHGFIALETEWWHYYLHMSNQFELLNLNFRQLQKINRKYP